MSEKDRLLRTLFEAEGREHVNIKFSRGSADDISVERFCREVNTALFMASCGIVEESPILSRPDSPVIDVRGM